VQYEELRFEGYAPGGVAVIVECLTDNRQRTISDVRHAFAKVGGNLGTDGSVGYLFKRVGVLSYEKGVDEDSITDAAILAGAEDVVVWPQDGQIDVITTPESFDSVRDAMVDAGFKPDHAEVTLRSETDISVGGEQAGAVRDLLARLEELDDVQSVHSNADLPAD
jgi:YebC/PmpR family DNA-binding regulatory protein